MKILFSEEEIDARVAQLGAELTTDYQGHDLLIVGVLNGSVIFLADLTRRVTLAHELGFVQASSYRGEATEAGSLQLQVESLPPVEGRDVLLLDDIFDTGNTLARLSEVIASRKPKTLKTAVLLWKQGRAEVTLEPDYFGFKIPDEFVVGYGLDYNDRYRHLPHIAVWQGNAD